MTMASVWENLQSYSVQLTLLIAGAGVLPFLLRMHLPQVRLVYWQLLLAACLLLPFVQPWSSSPTIDISRRPSITVPDMAMEIAAANTFDWEQAIVYAFALGAGFKAIWLVVGLLRLRVYGRRAKPLVPQPDCSGVHALVCTSKDVSSPVTFGIFAPVVLLPEQFNEFPRKTREAILCHELLHVARRDWGYMLVEECAAVVLWFHPAVWWLLDRIRLTREQAVDRETVKRTGEQESYVQALLTVTGAKARLDLAPAPLFLRRRHLIQRLELIVKEIHMSRRQVIASFSCSVVFAVTAALVAARSFPLKAAPQVQGTEVKLSSGSLELVHRPPLSYPVEARAKRIEGAVMLELTVDERGLVTDARVISGPEPLRKAALQTVLEWHYAKPSTPVKVQATLDYRLGQEPMQTPSGQASPLTPSGTPHILRTIKVDLRDPLRSSLQQKLAQYEGRPMAEVMGPVRSIVFEAEPHASLRWTLHSLTISLLNAGQEETISGEPAPLPKQIRVGGNIQAEKLINKVSPVYPPLAKQARIQGTVRFNATIAKDGTIRALELVSGHPLLVTHASEAVQQWMYQPTLLNGEPVEVITVIDVNFTLAP